MPENYGPNFTRHSSVSVLQFVCSIYILGLRRLPRQPEQALFDNLSRYADVSEAGGEEPFCPGQSHEREMRIYRIYPQMFAAPLKSGDR
jgi:hypothetical protein